MTIVSTDGRTLVSDTMGIIGNTIEAGLYQKIRESRGKVFALCGTPNFFQPLIDWYLSGAHPGCMPQADYNRGVDFVFWAFDDKKLHEYTSDAAYPMQIIAPNAMGSGRKFARAALALGYSALSATQTAMELDIYSGGPIHVYNLPENLIVPRVEPPYPESIQHEVIDITPTYTGTPFEKKALEIGALTP